MRAPFSTTHQNSMSWVQSPPFQQLTAWVTGWPDNLQGLPRSIPEVLLCAPGTGKHLLGGMQRKAWVPPPLIYYLLSVLLSCGAQVRVKA